MFSTTQSRTYSETFPLVEHFDTLKPAFYVAKWDEGKELYYLKETPPPSLPDKIFGDAQIEPTPNYVKFNYNDMTFTIRFNDNVLV